MQEHATARWQPRRPWQCVLHVTCICAVYERSGCKSTQRLDDNLAAHGSVYCMSPALLHLCSVREVRARQHTTAHACIRAVYEGLGCANEQRLDAHPATPGSAWCVSPALLHLHRVCGVRGRGHATARCPLRRPWRHAVRVPCTCAVRDVRVRAHTTAAFNAFHLHLSRIRGVRVRLTPAHVQYTRG